MKRKTAKIGLMVWSKGAVRVPRNCPITDETSDTVRNSTAADTEKGNPSLFLAPGETLNKEIG
jgi:hypothetical protein